MFIYLYSETCIAISKILKYQGICKKGYIPYIGKLWNVRERVLNCLPIVSERGGFVAPWTSMNMAQKHGISV